MTTFIDLSHPLNEKVSVWPGHNQPRIQNVKNVKDHGSKFTLLHLTTHSGTHIDAPSHFFQDRLEINEIQLKNLVGKAKVIDITRNHDEILKQITQLQNVDFVILDSGWAKYWGTPKFQEKYPVITEEMTKILLTKNLKGVGTDCLSVDCITSNTYPNHKLILNKNIIILENLANLQKVKDIQFEIYCIPLNIEGGDGSPSRIFAKI